jgi:hypothetical protein
MSEAIAKLEGGREFRRLLDAYNPGHTRFQIEHFVIGEQLTDWGKYRQALAELHGYYSSARSAHFEQRKAAARIDILRAEIGELEYGSAVDAAQAVLKAIEIEELDFIIEGHAKSLARAVHEASVHYELALAYETALQGVDQGQAELEFWQLRLGAQDARLPLPPHPGGHYE